MYIMGPQREGIPPGEILDVVGENCRGRHAVIRSLERALRDGSSRQMNEPETGKYVT